MNKVNLNICIFACVFAFLFGCELGFFAGCRHLSTSEYDAQSHAQFMCKVQGHYGSTTDQLTHKNYCEDYNPTTGKHTYTEFNEKDSK